MMKRRGTREERRGNWFQAEDVGSVTVTEGDGRTFFSCGNSRGWLPLRQTGRIIPSRVS